MDPTTLDTLSTTELLRLARERAGLTYTTRNRAALIRRLQRAHDAAPPAAPPPPPETAQGVIRRLWGQPVRLIAAELTRAGFKTPRGGSVWWPASVQHQARILRLPVCSPKRTVPASS